MADPGSQEKTEEATPQKLRKAREKGEVPKSQDLNTALMLTVALAALGLQLQTLGRGLADMTRGSFETALEPGLTNERIISGMGAAMDSGARMLLPFLIILAAFSFVFPFLQVGPLLALEGLKPKLDRLNPIAGMKRLFFELSAYIEFLKAFLKVTIIGLLAWIILKSHLREVLSLASVGVGDAARVTIAVLVDLALWTALSVMALAVLDLFFQRWHFAKKQRMSKQEVKDEYKQSEGDPHYKSQRKQMHQEILEHSVVESVRQSDVVVVNPTHIACALRYDPDEDDAPRLLSKGRGVLAERIKEVAKEEGIPIVRDRSLARALVELELDDLVPEALYEAVVEVLHWVEEVAISEGREVKWRKSDEEQANDALDGDDDEEELEEPVGDEPARAPEQLPDATGGPIELPPMDAGH